MRCAGLSVVFILGAAPLLADEKKIDARSVDRQLFDVLKEVHNRGADIYNAGDAAGCYRLFQGSLETARAMLSHRPEEQKFIDDAIAETEKQASLVRRAFILHETIEKLRSRLLPGPAAKTDKPELLNVPPREPKPQEGKPQPNAPELIPGPGEKQKEPPTPGEKKVITPKEGLSGHIWWKTRPLAGAEISFVLRSAGGSRVFKTVSDSDGAYVIERIEPGRYVVMLTKMLDNTPLLPERYSSTITSPLVAEIARGDTLDFMLQ